MSVNQKNDEIAQHLSTISKLKAETAEHKSAVEFHKHGLKSLHDTHTNTLEEMKLSHAGAMAEIDDQLKDLQSRHENVVRSLRSDIEKSRTEMKTVLANAETIFGHSTSPDMLHNHIQDIVDEKTHAQNLSNRLAGSNNELDRQLDTQHNATEVERQLADAQERIFEHQDRIRSLANEVADHEETLRAKNEIIRKRDAHIDAINTEKADNARIIEELEQQIESSFDQHNNRLSVIQAQGNQALVDAQARIAALEKDLEAAKEGSDIGATRSNTMKSHRIQSPEVENTRTYSMSSANLRKSASVASLPSPPPAIPLPPLPALPAIALQAKQPGNGSSPPASRHTSKELGKEMSVQQQQLIEEQEARIRTIEKHLHAEKQLTATLEEALVDLETQSNKIRADMDMWKKKAWQAEEEMQGLRKERRSERLSVQAVEEEREKRRDAEAARAHLEERMQALSRKKKKSALNCF